MLDAFWAAPPISRTITALVLLVSVSVYGGLLSGHRIIFAWPFIWKFPPEIWRFFTAFLLSGPQLAIIFDPYTIWRYASALETESPRFTAPGDFLTYIIFVGTFIVCLIAYLYLLHYFDAPHIICPPSQHLAAAVPGDEEDYPYIWCGSVIRNQSNGLVFGVGMVGMSIEKTHVIKQFAFCGFGSLQVLRRQLYFSNIFPGQPNLTANYILGSFIFTGGLITAIAYTYAQENRGKKVKFMVITMDVKWLPWANIFLKFVINGIEPTKVMIIGITAAHLYDFLTRLWPAFGGGRSIIWTPRFVSNMFGGPRRVTVAKHGTVFRPPTQPTSTYSSGWGSRGQGRRLGGE